MSQTTPTITAMLEAHPTRIRLDEHLVAACIAACVECAQACTACAEACLSERDVDPLRRCIRTDLDCADICGLTARVVARHLDRQSAILRDVLTACLRACAECADECASHADMHRHCQVCAAACRRCEEACERLLSSL